MIKKLLPLLLVLTPILVFGQKAEELKVRATEQMAAGRYGEAIEVLNAFITQNPQNPEGYNLRGLCYENRGQLESASYDFQRASKLDPQNKNPEFNKNYSRVTEIWYDKLRKSIDGYRREIAIDSSKPDNYLQIGIAHSKMREFPEAEIWYKRYISRKGRISPDELIRYTEVLIANKKTREAQAITKEYIEYHPLDWRLYSRYGYFSLWLGENNEAIKAFEKSLEIKPYFKEAEEGLVLAKREGFVQQTTKVTRKEFPIDRYYRLIRQNPDDDQSRFNLIDELVKVQRYEEALTQLEALSSKYYGDERYDSRADLVYDLREELYRSKIAEAMAIIEEDPTDKKAIQQAATYHEYLGEYEEAYAYLEYYFEEVPDEEDESMRFQFAKLAAWSGSFENAAILLDELLEDYPDNLDYQLFRAQVAVWMNQDLEIAGEYLNNVIAVKPNNIDVLISMGSYQLNIRDFDEAEAYAAKAATIDPSNPELIKLLSNIDFQKMRAEEERLFLILEKGRKLVQADSCSDALPFYESYLDQAEPNDIILKEYGDIHFCAKNYKTALGIYDGLLEKGYNYDVALQRAKVVYTMGDSVKAVTAFEEVVANDPGMFEPRLFLADAYAKAEMNDSAVDELDSLLTWDLDSTQNFLVEQRLKWIPAAGLKGIIERFPTSISVAPSATFYSDNLTFRYTNIGTRLDMGATPYLTIGVSFNQVTIKSDSGVSTSGIIREGGTRSFSSFKWHFFLTPIKDLSTGFAFGTLNSPGIEGINEYEANLRYDLGEKFMIAVNYLNTDAGVLLYSPNLVADVARFQTELYKIQGYYTHSSGFKVEGSFQYVTVGDGTESSRADNKGNDFKLRVSRKVYQELLLGYEYFYSNFKYSLTSNNSKYSYYSPQNFESHNLTLDWPLETYELFKAYVGGKLGYVIQSKFLLREIFTRIEYTPFQGLIIAGNLNLGSTSRDDNNYNYVSGSISAYWNIY
ncbi:MAG: tetratricopeptide repeat protein [Melioribacteraceae bacterium]|nr:tetratricopeptide repeat protein [Melioribacteraceae bacterium]MCF8412820.1 tetratricopeptide repeat protein [Melioribacteraceae bacterium]MCF8431154.1 tetratricopeptide repeat protein [Melioribacteraceae bacterium]